MPLSHGNHDNHSVIKMTTCFYSACIQMTPSEECFNRDGGLEVAAWLLDCCDEEVGSFDLQ